MSLVTTAMVSSPASTRHSAATSAVLPLPTGPPMPSRKARGPAVARARSRAAGAVRTTWTWWSWLGSLGWPMLRSKETYLRGSVGLGVHVEKGRGRGGQLSSRGRGGRLRGHEVGGARKLGQQHGHRDRVEG